MADDRILERVRGLLAKAESSEFPEEAEAFMAKAQQLMSRHAIDEAIVGNGGTDHEPRLVDVPIDNPYAGRKASLLGAVASANRCEVVWNSHSRVATLIGYPTDVAAVDTLFTSLLLQGATVLAKLGTHTDEYGRNRTRSFRNAFWAGYATRLGIRLREANESATAEAVERHGSALAPVLVSRSEAVESLVHREFPRLRTQRTTITNAHGYYAGDAAAREARLRSRRQVRSGRP